MELLYLTLLIIGSTMAQRSPYAGRPLPGLLPRFQLPQEESDIGERVDIPSSTLAPALKGTLHEDKVVQRVAEWPEERQPFWFKNREVINSQIHQSVSGDDDIVKGSRKTTHTVDHFEEEQKLKRKLEQEHIKQEIERQRLKEEIERKEYEEEVERQRLKEETEKQKLKEEIERERLRQERERQKLDEEREEQRLRHQREHEKLIHKQQSLHIKHHQESVQLHQQSNEEESDSGESPLWKKQINSGMRINKHGLTTTERAKKKFFNLF